MMIKDYGIPVVTIAISIKCLVKQIFFIKLFSNSIKYPN